MYCDKCGNQLRDGAKFCNKCGAPIESNSKVDESVYSTIDNDKLEPLNQHSDNDAFLSDIQNNTSSSKMINNKKRIMITSTIVTTVVIGIVLLIIFLLSKPSNSTELMSSFSIPQAFTFEEKSDDDNSQQRLVSASANTEISHEFYSNYQSSDTGRFAFASQEDKDYVFVYDIDGKLLLQKQIREYDFLLSRNGEKLVYRSPDNDGFIIVDVSSDKETKVEIDGDFSLDGISYNGEIVVIYDYLKSVCYKNGREDNSLGTWTHLLGMSNDNSYIYYYSSYHETSQDMDGNTTSEEDKLELRVLRKDGTRIKIADLNPKFSVYLIAMNYAGNEALFWNDNNLYYYNSSNGLVKTISGVKNPPSSFENARNEYGYGFNYDQKGCYSQPQILNSFYFDCENYEGTAIGYLNNEYEYTVLASTDNEYNTSWLSISNDRSKLWCINNGKVSYYEANDKGLISKTSDISVMMNSNGEKKYPLLSASSDGNKACFISSDGVAYLVTPETINNPQKVLDGAKVPVFGSDDQLYIRKGTPGGNIYDPGDLYKITTDNQAVFQYSDVIYTLPIESEIYIFTSNSDYTYTILKEDNNQYTIVSNKAGDHLSLLW